MSSQIKEPLVLYFGVPLLKLIFSYFRKIWKRTLVINYFFDTKDFPTRTYFSYKQAHEHLSILQSLCISWSIFGSWPTLASMQVFLLATIEVPTKDFHFFFWPHYQTDQKILEAMQQHKLFSFNKPHIIKLANRSQWEIL